MTENTIFIVDDDEGHAELIRDCLEEAGIANPIRWFATGNDVLEHIFSEPMSRPVLMLLDLNMPGLSGTEVLERLKRDERTQATPVIIVTTSSQGPEIEACYELGCNLYITKPVQHAAFVDAIRTLGLVFQITAMPAAVA